MKKLLLLLSISILTVFAQNSKFVVWGDSQFQNPEVFESIIKETIKLNPDCVIHIGDMIHGYTYDSLTAQKEWQRFKNQIQKLKCDFFPTPGNHDRTTNILSNEYKKVWGDNLFYSFTKNENHFIVLNTTWGEKLDTLIAEEIEFLKKDLEINKNKNNFIFMHSPLFYNKKINWDEIHNILKDNNVKAVFAGHNHIYNFYKKDEVNYFIINSSGNMEYKNHLLGFSHDFIEINTINNKVTYKVNSEGKVYLPEDVAANETGNSQKYLIEPVTFPLNSEKNSVDTIINYKLKNNAPVSREFTIVWKNSNGWKINPAKLKIYLDSNKDTTIEFAIKNFQIKNKMDRNTLPFLQVSSTCSTLNKKIVKIVQNQPIFFPPIIYAEKLKTKILFDGNPEELKGDLKYYKFYTGKQNNISKDTTYVSIKYDENNLYLSFKEIESNVSGLVAGAYGKVPLVFGDDDFEVLITDKLNQKSLYRYIVNSKNTVLTSSPKGIFKLNGESKVYVDKSDFWSGEIIIPLSELNNTNKNDLRINFRRNRTQSESSVSDWSFMQRYPPYQPEYFGVLKFIK